MATETITKTFLSLGGIIVSVAVSSILGFNYIGDRNEKAIDKAIDKAFESKCKPLYEDNAILKAFAKENRALITDNANDIKVLEFDIKNNALSVNLFIDWYNRTYHKDFLRPVDMEEQNFKKIKK